MKKILIILLLIPAMTYGQNVYEVTGSQSELKSRALLWAAENFNDLKEAKQVETEEMIVLKGNFDQMMGIGLLQIWFTMKIDFKDGRYRYYIYDTYMQQADGRTFPLTKANKKFQAKALERFNSIEESLREHMKVDDSW